MKTATISLVVRRLTIMLALCLVAALGLVGSAQSDAHVGTWKLNAGKSTYNPGPPPRSQTRTYTPFGDGLKAVIETVNPLGAKTTSEYSAHYDGKDTPLSGNNTADAIAVTRVDAWTFDAVLKKGGKVVSTNRNTVSKDGKTMTVTAKGVNATGQPVSSTVVLDKQ